MEIRRPLSRIWIRLFAFNVLLVFVPVLGMLFLGSFERQLLKAQERTMVQEGRLLAASLAAEGRLSLNSSRKILRHLGQRHETRLRVVDPGGKLLADSARLGPRREPGASGNAVTPRSETESWLYRLGALPFRLLHRLQAPTEPGGRDSYDRENLLLGPEIHAALAGRYGATTRVSRGSPPTVLLYSAIPIETDRGIEGVVLVSQSTYRIFQTLYQLRLDVFKVFLASLLAALLISLLLAMTISRPLSRLKQRAEELLDRRGRLIGSFRLGTRKDEIGDLQRSLSLLTGRLECSVRAMESFSADLSHEFKNPLAAIRAANEVAMDTPGEEERKKLLKMIEAQVSRMERLLSGVREISRLDVAIEDEDMEELSFAEILSTLLESFQLRAGIHGPKFELSAPAPEVIIRATSDHLTQALEKLLDNAMSFSPQGGHIRLQLFLEGAEAVLQVEDEGPGIAEEDLEKIFRRFYTGRREEHVGLGLALSRAIVEALGGSIRAVYREGKGALIELRLPRIRVC